jgi:hypothetical protein
VLYRFCVVAVARIVCAMLVVNLTHSFWILDKYRNSYQQKWSANAA